MGSEMCIRDRRSDEMIYFYIFWFLIAPDQPVNNSELTNSLVISKSSANSITQPITVTFIRQSFSIIVVGCNLVNPHAHSNCSLGYMPMMFFRLFLVEIATSHGKYSESYQYIASQQNLSMRVYAINKGISASKGISLYIYSTTVMLRNELIIFATFIICLLYTSDAADE